MEGLPTINMDGGKWRGLPDVEQETQPEGKMDTPILLTREGMTGVARNRNGRPLRYSISHSLKSTVGAAASNGKSGTPSGSSRAGEGNSTR